MRLLFKIWKKIRSLEISVFKLNIIVSIYFMLFLNYKLWSFVFENFTATFWTKVVVVPALFTVGSLIILLFFTLINIRFIGKILVALIIIASANISYQMIYLGVFIDTEIIQSIFETTTREALDLLTLRNFIFVLFLGIIPAFILCLIKVNYPSFIKSIKRNLIIIPSILLIILILVFSFYKELSPFFRNNKSIQNIYNPYNYIKYTLKYYENKFKVTPEFQYLDENPTREKREKRQVFIYILGETARSANFSLYGYEKNTNPLLAKQENLIVFDTTVSCGTATALSVPCLFSDKTRTEFDVNKSYYEENLMDIIKKTGYDVFWYDNDDGCKGVCDKVENELAVKTAKDSKFCKGSYCQDDVLLEGLKERLNASNEDIVIVLHAMGSHGPTYYRRVPDEFKVFNPRCDTQDIQSCTLEELSNTYDNTILYTDYIINSVIEILKTLKNVDASMLYISDHGESLGENNIYLHGFPYYIAPKEQKEIPFLLWLSEDNSVLDKTCLMQKTKNKGEYSHDNIYHSVISMLGIKTKLYRPELDILSSCMIDIKK